ncbi:unnamed protein product [Clonostachys rhizophaga]|uniref:Major facilitator superfamily (MFS) profile domain-containing protein n=1 Tax=Clonostachys rhizophaga TaxID=160324 RepID=A0A9N9YGG1_9HYPO|nr:unnamed protein product [Clonostachys rhizophaga]
MEPPDNVLPTVDEAAPLLARHEPTASTHVGSGPADPSADDTTPSDGMKSLLYPSSVFFIFVLSFVADLGGSLVDIPEVRLLEMAVCRDYYREHDPSVIGPQPGSYVDENLCKVNKIQADLAYIRAIKSLLMTVPADRIGRKPVAFLGMLGQVMAYFWIVLVCYFHQAFPTRLVLLSPAFLIVGGGSRVLSAIMATVIVDVAPENMRTTIFYAFGAGLLVTDTVAAPFGSWLLSKGLWLPFKLSAPIICLSFPLILTMPETLMARKKAEASNGHQPIQDRSPISLFRRWISDMQQALRSLHSIVISKNMVVCLFILFLSAFSGMTGVLFIQYTSKLLDWSISTAGYILGVKSLVTLCTLIALASLTQILERRTGVRPLYVDVWVIRSSLAALAVGAVFVAAAEEPVLLVAGSLLGSAGNGVSQALKGLLATLADTSSTGQLFAGAAFLELLAQFAGSMTFAALFEVGLSLESLWGLGLPFFISGILDFLAAALSFTLPVR